ISPRHERLSMLPDKLDATSRCLGEREHTVATLLAPLRDRHRNAVRELEIMQERNAAVIAGEPTTPRERIHREQEKLRAKPVNDFIENDQSDSAKPKVRPVSDFM